MTIVDTTTVPGPDLAAALLRCAGDPARTAAVQLVIDTHFLSRTDFLTEYVEAFTDDEVDDTDKRWLSARIDWRHIAAAPLPFSDAEQALLNIAASLAHDQLPVNLSTALTGLDAYNVRAVLTAIACAANKPGLAVDLSADPLEVDVEVRVMGPHRDAETVAQHLTAVLANPLLSRPYLNRSDDRVRFYVRTGTRRTTS